MALVVMVMGSAMLVTPALSRPLRDYTIDVWTSRHGLPHNSLRSVAQTPDGQLWMATWEGLVRYNGLQFITYDRSTTPGLLDNGLGSLHVDRLGRLWTGDSRGNVLRMDTDGRWTHYPAEPPSPGVLIQAIDTDAQGRTWLLYEGRGVGYLDEQGQFQFTPAPEGVSMTLTYPRMVVDGQGQVWIGTLEGLVVRDANGVLRNSPGEFGLPPGPAWPHRARDGAIWIVSGNAVYRMSQGRPQFHHRFDALPAITEMLIDSQGFLWVGSESDGITRLSPEGKEERLPAADQPSGRVLTMYEDTEGSIWIGANGGLHRIRESLFSSYTMRDGLVGNYLRAVVEDRRGRLWLGGSQGLNWLDHNDEVHIQNLPRLEGKKGSVSVLSLAVARDDSIWVGTYADGVMRIDSDGTVRHFPDIQRLAAGNVRAIVEDKEGTLWVGSMSGLLQIKDGQVQRANLPGLPRELITALGVVGDELWIGSTVGVRRIRDGRVERIPVFEQGGGRTAFGFHGIGQDMWISTDRGLYRYRDEKLVRLGLEHGLPVDTILQMTVDRLGNAWMSTNRGVLRTYLQHLEQVADGRRAYLTVERYTEIDGMANSQGNGSSGPAAWLRRDGTYWVATAGGVSMVDPARLERFRAHPAPPPMIEDVLVDGQPVDRSVDQPVTVPAGARLTVSYIGLSYLISERIRYRTRLVGLENQWVERQTHRSLDYSTLPPGSYTLQVQAMHPGGQWSAEPAELEVVVTPHWWQRPLLWISALVMLVITAGGLHRYSVYRYQLRNQRLAQEVQERTFDLQLQAENLLRANQEKSQLLEQLREQAELFARQAHEDPLTTLPNRRAFNEVLSREYSRYQRTGNPLCLIVMDLDYFKSINDRFNHTIGDKVLQEVGQLLVDTCREADLPARLGGEEFALLLTDTRLEHAEQLCARLKERFRRQTNWGGIEGLQLTFSAGLVEVRADDRTPISLYKRADAALYRAKNEGRDLTYVG